MTEDERIGRDPRVEDVANRTHRAEDDQLVGGTPRASSAEPAPRTLHAPSDALNEPPEDAHSKVPTPQALAPARGGAVRTRGRRSLTKTEMFALELDDVRTDRDNARAEEAWPDDLNPPTLDGVTRAVHERLLRSRDWRQVSSEQVRAVLDTLDLDLDVPVHRTPRLQITRLRFSGTKTMAGHAPAPVAYDQTFGPGVNVVHMPKNSCGKSTIFNLIRLALTGDASRIAPEVRPWISQLWLHFTLGDARYTVHVEQASGGLRGYIAGGHEAVSLSALDSSTVATLARFDDADQAASRMQQFFFDHLHLAALGWTNKNQEGVLSDRFMSWRTYWQALAMPDNSEGYLVVDKESNIGNQQGLLLSMLLGLRFAEPINSLQVEGRKIEVKNQSATDEQRAAAAAQHDATARVAELEAELARLNAAHLAGRAVLDERGDAQALQATVARHERQLTELRELSRRRDELSQSVQRERARARSLRLTAKLRLHFTGLAVSLCPNCDEDVAPEAVAREQTSHDCRLCGKAARPADAADADVLRADADAKEAQAAVLEEQRDQLTQLVRDADDAVQRDALQVDAIRARLRAVSEAAFPSSEELAARDDVLLRLGAARSAQAYATSAAERFGALDEDAPVRAAVITRARTVLREVSEHLNAALLADLNSLTQEMVAALGAESVSEVHCSAVGTVTLRKHGVQISFGSVTAPGERLRIKLAFFLAMMRLGRIAGHGRHPGLLLIDQPGSDEMVDTNFATLAARLQEINAHFAHEVQVICFTARAQLTAATVPEQVYRGQAGEWMF